VSFFKGKKKQLNSNITKGTEGMKIAQNVLLGIGVLLLVLAMAGGFSANPSRVFNIKITTVVLFANTAFLLAIIAKLFEKN
jgi:hypothetical protein